MPSQVAQGTRGLVVAVCPGMLRYRLAGSTRSQRTLKEMVLVTEYPGAGRLLDLEYGRQQLDCTSGCQRDLSSIVSRLESVQQ